MYYHTSSELGIEATERLQRQNDRILLNNNKLDNCGKMSLNDAMKEIYLTENRVMDFLSELNQKVTELNMSPIVSVPFISSSLNIPEDMVKEILRKNNIDMFEVEEEEEY